MKDRLPVLMLFFAAGFVVLAVRLVWVQVVVADELAQRARDQRMTSIELSPRRGTIYDREGEPLAISVEAPSVFASPRLIKDPEQAARVLASVLGGSVRDYERTLKSDAGFIYIARTVDRARCKELEARLKALGIDGIGFQEDFRRVYPAGHLAGQVLGFVGTDQRGLAGLEYHYDELLAGTPGVLIGECDPRRIRPIPGGVQKEIPPSHGTDIVLTIDKDIQAKAEVELYEAVREWGARAGSVTVMDPRTGEIYAMASVPRFDPNEYRRARADVMRNRPITDAYEPGSTFKALTAAAAIEAGICTPDTMFTLPPTLSVGGRTIHEAHPRPTVRWTLTEIVAHSSNVGTVKVGLALGPRGLMRAMDAFGVTEAPGTDFPGVAKGLVPPLSAWSASTIGNVPFGQGVSLTQLQLVRAVGALANDGVLTTPHFLLSVPRGTGEPARWPKRRAVSRRTARLVTEMLVDTVANGTGTAAAVSGYTVAGKTGTAQKPRPDGRGYKGGGYVSSFIGYLPAEDPRLLVCVTLDRPTRAIYGGVVAAPAFARIAQFAAEHLEVPPSPRTAIEAAKKRVSTVSARREND